MAKKTVLIIEDDQFLTKALRIKFKNEGIEVVIARDGRQALDMLTSASDPPGVVLLDLMLPSVSGFDVLAAIRTNERWKNVPVVIMSNLGQQKEFDRGKALGATEYVVKANVKISDVVELVKKQLPA